MGAKPVVTKTKEQQLLETPLLVKGSDTLRPIIAKVIELGQVLDDLLVLAHARRDQIVREFDSITLLTREQAADRLAMSPAKLDRETRKKSLPKIKIDRRVRYAVDDLKTYIASRRVEGRGYPAPPAPRRAATTKQT